MATDERPLQKCLDDISHCDLYIGIFAWRYGYIPQHDNPQGKSITELEFDHARSMSIQTLVFLTGEKAAWPVPYTDTGDDATRIRLLREKLGKELTVGFFHNEESLATEVSVAIANWDKQRFVPDPGLLRSRAHELAVHIVQEIGEKYISHLYIKRYIDQSVLDFLDQPGGGLLLIVDRAGNGKTNLLCRICETVRAPYAPFLIRAKYSSNLSQDFRHLFRRASDISWDNFESQRNKSLENILVLVDGINEYAALRSASSDLMCLLDDILRLRAKVIITCRDLFWNKISEGLEERFHEYIIP